MEQPYYIFIAFILGFLVAQLIKFVVGLVRHRGTGKKRSFKEMIGYLTRSGGMPSGHSAAMTAATTVALLGTMRGTSGIALDGSNATAFFVLLCVDFVVFYDAVNVRKAVGEQGEALNKLLREKGEKELRVVRGHTVAEVLVGILLGVVIGFGVLYIAGQLGWAMPNWMG